ILIENLVTTVHFLFSFVLRILAAHRTIRLVVFAQLFAIAEKLQRNLKTKENKKCTVVNKFSMRINQHHPKTAKFINSKKATYRLE
ncbi:MAG: hypothetical protein AAF587_33915, partial [Bacteroidota bacterium]